MVTTSVQEVLKYYENNKSDNMTSGSFGYNPLETELTFLDEKREFWLYVNDLADINIGVVEIL